MAFAVTVNSPLKRAERISRNMGMYAGQVTIDSYNSTLIECTAITKFFVPISNTNATDALFPHGIVSLSVDGVSDNGYSFKWDATTGAFKCYSPTTIDSTAISIPVDSAVAGSALLFDSGGGAAALHATSAVGSIVLAADVAAAAGEASDNTAVGTVNFVAVGFIKR